MPTFTPPLKDGEPRHTKGRHPGDMLMRHYRSHPTGTNVWKVVGDIYTERQPDDPDTVLVLYYGGHVHEVSDDEAAALTAAGYGAYIT
jgi:hypothetical protein